jgi:hypothetical protein
MPFFARNCLNAIIEEESHMKKLEMVIKPEKLETLKSILDDSQSSGVMVIRKVSHGCIVEQPML